MGTEIYLSGTFRFETDEDLSDEEVQELYRKAYGQTIMLQKPFDDEIRAALGMPDTLTDYIDEVEILGGI